MVLHRGLDLDLDLSTGLGILCQRFFMEVLLSQDPVWVLGGLTGSMVQDEHLSERPGSPSSQRTN